MADLTVLTPGQEIRPKLDEKKAIELVQQLYGFRVKKIVELNSYDDKNYHVICDNKHENFHVREIVEDGYVLKILNSLDSRNVAFVEAQNEMMLYLNQRNIICPIPVKNLCGSFYSVEKLHDGSNEGYVIRLLVYRPGKILYGVPITSGLLRDVGSFAARLIVALSNFSHPAYENRSTLWMMAAVPKLRDFLFALKNVEERKIIIEIIENFEKNVLTITDKLQCGIIHGDLNEQNLLVDSEGTRVTGIIDFGDTQFSCLIFELAIAVCYMIIQARDTSMAKFVIDGFQSVKKLTKIEKKIMKICVCARLSQSLTLGAYSHSKDSKNDYLLVTQKPGWDILKKLWPMDDEEVLRIWGLQDP